MILSARVEGGARTVKPIRWDSVAPKLERRVGSSFLVSWIGSRFLTSRTRKC